MLCTFTCTADTDLPPCRLVLCTPVCRSVHRILHGEAGNVFSDALHTLQLYYWCKEYALKMWVLCYESGDYHKKTRKLTETLIVFAYSALNFSVMKIFSAFQIEGRAGAMQGT